MNYIQPRDRHQISFGSLDEQIEADNPVRFIEAIVEQLDLIQLSYHNNTLKTEGRPPFSANVFLKLYLYGYLHGIPACRQAGAAAADQKGNAKRSIELQWLLAQLAQLPQHCRLSESEWQGFAQHVQTVCVVFKRNRVSEPHYGSYRQHQSARPQKQEEQLQSLEIRAASFLHRRKN